MRQLDTTEKGINEIGLLNQMIGTLHVAAKY